MRIKCRTLIKAGIVAAIASLPIAVPAQAGEMSFVSEFAADRNLPSVSQRDGHAVTPVLNDPLGAAESDPTLQGRLHDTVFWSAGEPGSSPDQPDPFASTDLASYLNSAGGMFVTGAGPVAAPSNAEMGVYLGRAGSPLDNFSGPDAAIDAINSMTTGPIDFRDVSPLHVIAASEIPPNPSDESDDQPLLIKWFYSLIEAVGNDEQCIDPTDGRATKCDSRIAAQQ